MNDLFEMRALLFVGECLFASALLPAAAWALSKLTASASMRHFLWLTAFGVMLVLPIAALVVPSHIVMRQQRAQSESVPALVEQQDAASAADIAPVEAAPVAQDPVPAPGFAMPDPLWMLAALWLLGAGFAGSRALFGLFCLASLRRSSRPHALGHGEVPDIEYKGRECELRLSRANDGPMTWGTARPVILLPRSSRFWSRERLHAVLLHELAHVRRRDSLSQALALIACALYWPNPLVWRAARALRREAEIAADDAVIAWGMKPSAYAGELLELACESSGAHARPAALSMASKTALETRLKSVLAPNQSRRGVTSMDILKIACLGFALTAALAFARPDVVAAQDNDAPPAPPSVAAAPLPPAPPAPADAMPAVEPADPATPPSPPDVDDVPPVPPPPPPPPHMAHMDHMVRVIQVEKLKHLKNAREMRANMDRAVAQAHQAEIELQRAEPEIEKAISEAKIEETVNAALAKEEPRIRAEVARALAKARPQIRAALAQAHVSARVAKAMAEAQPRIDAAMAKAQKDMESMKVDVYDEDNQADEADEKDNEH